MIADEEVTIARVPMSYIIDTPGRYAKNESMTLRPHTLSDITVTHPLELAARAVASKTRNPEQVEKQLDPLRRAHNISAEETRAFVKELLDRTAA